MIITFFNKKGGCGKTAIAFSCAKDAEYFLISNDDSTIEEIYPDKAKVMEEIQFIKDANIVYDLGGFVDENTIPIFKNSDKIFIPTLLDANSIKRTINTVSELEEHNKNIFIIINNYTKKDLEKYSEAVKQLEKLKRKIFYIPKSEAIPNSTYLGKTITEQYKKDGQGRNNFKTIYEAYKLILEEIK